jgi:hypothetical protein
MHPDAVSLDPTEAVHAALIARLKADAALTTLVAGRVYVRPPANVPYPHILVEAPTLGRFDTLGRYGKTITTQIRGLSQQKGDVEALQIRSRIVALTDGYRAALAAPFRVFWCELQPSPPVYTTSEAGVVTAHAPVIVGVWAR